MPNGDGKGILAALNANGKRPESGCRRQGGQGKGLGRGRGMGNGAGRRACLNPDGTPGQGLGKGPCGNKNNNNEQK